MITRARAAEAVQKSAKRGKLQNAPMPSIELVGIGHDEQTGQWYRRYRFKDADGSVVERLISFEDSADGDAKVLKRFAGAGYPTPTSNRAKRAFTEHLESLTTDERFQVVSQTGWDGNTFCTPLGIHGDCKMDVVLQFDEKTANHKFAQSGTYSDWKRYVADLARGNSLLTFCLASGFVGPVLKLLNAEGGGFQLVGTSSSGKTTHLVATGSIWGGGGPNGFAELWLTTSNALDLTAAVYNDTLLLLDETGLANTQNETDAANLVLSAAYRLTGGQEKARHTDTARRRSWRAWLLSTSEHSLIEMALRGKVSWSPGQLVRIIDIRVNRSDGSSSFENLHGHPNAAAFADHLKSAAKTYFGTAGQAFLEALSKDIARNKAALCAWVCKRMNFYRQRAPETQLGGLHDRVVSRFALVYAAGRLAAKYGILPSTREELFTSVRHCQRQAMIEPLVQFAGPQKSGVDIVKSYLESIEGSLLVISKEKDYDCRDVRRRLGFINYVNGEREFLFDLETFKREICGGRSWKDIRRELHNAGFLNVQQGGKNTVTRLLPKPLGKKRVISISGRITAISLRSPSDKSK